MIFDTVYTSTTKSILIPSSLLRIDSITNDFRYELDNPEYGDLIINENREIIDQRGLKIPYSGSVLAKITLENIQYRLSLEIRSGVLITLTQLNPFFKVIRYV